MHASSDYITENSQSDILIIFLLLDVTDILLQTRMCVIDIPI
jgi:hypothetical protein